MVDHIKNFAQLLSLAKGTATSKGKSRAGFIWADAPYLKAARRAADEDLIEPILIGPNSKMKTVADDAGIGLDGMSVSECESRVDSVACAIRLMSEGKIDFLVKGDIPIALLLSRLVERSTDFRSGNNHVSHVAVFEHQFYPRLLLMSDGAVTVAPDIDKKLAIVKNAVKIAHLLEIDVPRVAILAAVEIISSNMPATTEAAIISKMNERGRIGNCLIDGPLSLDVALVPEIARMKGIDSRVAGHSDIIIVPNIETGNSLYKAMSIFAGAGTAGVIVGGKVPISISSRCDTVDNIFHSIILGSVAAQSNDRLQPDEF